jgi:hypothetical protein
MAEQRLKTDAGRMAAHSFGCHYFPDHSFPDQIVTIK